MSSDRIRRPWLSDPDRSAIGDRGLRFQRAAARRFARAVGGAALAAVDVREDVVGERRDIGEGLAPIPLRASSMASSKLRPQSSTPSPGRCDLRRTAGC